MIKKETKNPIFKNWAKETNQMTIRHKKSYSKGIQLTKKIQIKITF